MPRSTDAPRTPRVPRCRARRRVTGCPGPVLCRWLVTPTRCAACKRIRRAAPCVAPWHDDSGIEARGHPPAFAVHPRRPTGTGRPRASRLHVVVRTNPIARMERKAARSRRRNQRRSEYPGRSAIHVCNTMRCVSVFFHSLVPVSDTSDPLKRLPGRQHPRSRSRPIQPCKERTMLHAARPRGHVPGRGQPSHPVRKRERFETETRRRTNRHRRVGSAWDGQSPYNRLTAGGAPRPDACARPCPFPRLATARPEPAVAAWSRLPSLRTRVVLQHRPRPPRLATRGVTRGARVARHDAAGRLARRGAVPLGHRANTLAFGHGTPCVRPASPPRIRHAPNRSRQPRRRAACLC